jgi:acyl carrier protein
MNIDRLHDAKIILAEASQRSVDEIPDNASINNWDGWNSLVHMHLILAMEIHLGRELSPEVIVEISTLNEVAKYLTN